MRLFLVILSLALVQFFPEPGPVRADTVGPLHMTAPCWFTPKGKGRVDCGYLTVPENRSRPGKATVRLPYVRIRSVAQLPQSPPVFYFSGGPGAGVLDELNFPPAVGIRFWQKTQRQMFPDRDLVLFDQRGSGRATPNLNCEELDDDRIRMDMSAIKSSILPRQGEFSKPALIACRDRLVAADVDLAQYNSRNIVVDIEALRVALGYQKIVPLAVSYGTKIALHYLRRFPDVVSDIILDSVAPPTIRSDWAFYRSFEDALAKLFVRCTAHGACVKAYPDLERVLRGVLRDLRRKSVVVDASDVWRGPKSSFLSVDDVAFLNVIHASFYNTMKFRQLPQLIFDFSKRRMTLFEEHVRHAVRFGALNAALFEGAYWSVSCYDEYSPSASGAAVMAPQKMAYVRRWFDAKKKASPCADWPVDQLTASNREPVVSSVRALVLVSKYDHVTTQKEAEEVVQTLSNATLVVLPRPGHSFFLYGGCGDALISKFLGLPEEPLDLTCVQEAREPWFAVRY